MKSILLTCTILLSSLALFAQGHKQVNWEFSSRKDGKATVLVMTATIEKGWHIYSQNMNGDGPVPTSFTYEFPKGAKASGKTAEPEPIKHYDENFQMDVLYYNDKVEFVQAVGGKFKAGDVVKGKVTYMICNDEMCLPPVDVAFEIKL